MPYALQLFSIQGLKSLFRVFLSSWSLSLYVFFWSESCLRPVYRVTVVTTRHPSYVFVSVQSPVMHSVSLSLNLLPSSMYHVSRFWPVLVFGCYYGLSLCVASCVMTLAMDFDTFWTQQLRACVLSFQLARHGCRWTTRLKLARYTSDSLSGKQPNQRLIPG